MLRVAILGAGIGAQHMAGYRALQDHYRVLMVCDRALDKAQALASQAADCRAVAEINQVLGDSRIDLVDICLPPHLHGPVALSALANDKHVICEKPVAGSVLEVDRIAAAARDHQRLFVPVFQYRYGRGLYQLAGLQDRDLLGRPLVATLETHWDRGPDYYAVDWRGQWASERGGAVLGHAIHVHDLISRFFGPATAVSAMLDTRVNPIETEDCAAISMRTRSGGLVTSSVTLGGAGDTSRLRMVFEHLTAESGRNPYAPGADTWTFTPRDADSAAAIDSALAEIDRDIADRPTGFAGQFLAIAQHLGSESSDMVTVEDGVRSIELVAAIYQSARIAAQVALPLDRSLQICSDWVPERSE